MTDIATHGYANPEVLVRTELVAGHRDDPLVRIARVISSGRDGFCEGDYLGGAGDGLRPPRHSQGRGHRQDQAKVMRPAWAPLALLVSACGGGDGGGGEPLTIEEYAAAT